jgi:hypothetical protein
MNTGPRQLIPPPSFIAHNTPKIAPSHPTIGSSSSPIAPGKGTIVPKPEELIGDSLGLLLPHHSSFDGVKDWASNLQIGANAFRSC